MPYIGNTVQTQGFTPAIDYFSGNGVTVTFTLSRPVASVAQMIVAIDNVIQNPSFAFTVAGNAITFTSAPLSGTNNIWVEYTSLITTYNAISQDPTVIGDITTTGGGLLSTGDFGNAYLAGVIVDYVTGLGRVTVGPSEGITLYNGGTSARTALATFSSGGNVGIGTVSPTQKLSVNGGQSFNSAITFTGNGYELGKDGANFLCFSGGTAGTRFIDQSTAVEWMRIDSSGNVGIGTSSPGVKLDVNGGDFRIQQSAATARQRFIAGSNQWNVETSNSTNGYAIYDATAGQLRTFIDTSGNFKFNSGYGSAAVAYGCRAWVNFNGTGTPAIRASGGVSSITDLSGSGYYRVNFSNAMPDINFVTFASGSNGAGQSDYNLACGLGNESVSYGNIWTGWSSGSYDMSWCYAAMFR